MYLENVQFALGVFSFYRAFHPEESSLWNAKTGIGMEKSMRNARLLLGVFNCLGWGSLPPLEILS